MLKVVFFLVVGAFVIGAALGVLVMALQVIGFVLTYLFKFLAWVFRQLGQAYGSSCHRRGKTRAEA